MKKLILFTALCLLISESAFSQIWASTDVQEPSCDTICSGIIFINAGGGAIPYMLYVNGAPFAAFTTFYNIINVCPGTYDVSVIDNNGFDITGVITLTVASVPKPSTTVNVSNASCPTCNDGAAATTTVGGLPPYSYLWTNGASGPVAQNLSPGIYYVYTSSLNGCTDIDTVLIGVGTTGLSDADSDNSLFNLYPNPSSKGALLKYLGDETNIMQVEILDPTGRIVSEKMQLTSGSLQIPENLLAPGFYLIRITGDIISHIRMVVK